MKTILYVRHQSRIGINQVFIPNQKYGNRKKHVLERKERGIEGG
jgi:hypothetical protein